MIYFGRLNPIFQTCDVSIDVLAFQFEKKRRNMFGVKVAMEESFHAFVVGFF